MRFVPALVIIWLVFGLVGASREHGLKDRATALALGPIGIALAIANGPTNGVRWSH